jgi:site-specific DNA-cytosine methylase
VSTLDVVAEILREVAPRALKARQIVELAGTRLPTASRTPETVVSRDLAVDVRDHGAASRFLRVGRGAFVLKESLPTAFYNDNDEYAAAWTRNLIAAGEIAAGVVDERSIRDIKPADVASYRQCHFFSGIGVWSRALRDAGWPDDVNVWSGSCPCFPAGTLILTQRGNISIEDVQVGDVVLTHRARWRRVQAVGSENGRCVQLKGQGHWGLVCTPEHPFLSGDEEWTSADQMAGKRWSTVAHVPSFMEIPPLETKRGAHFDTCSKGFRAKGERSGKSIYLGLYRTKEEAQAARDAAVRDGKIDVRGADAVNTASLEFARFLGYWVGDGWTTGDAVCICGAKEDGDFLKSLMESAGLSSSASLERTSSRARCGSKTLVAWLRLHFGQGAAHKRIPAWLHGASAEYRQAFLGGYFAADGHRGSNSLCFTSVSRALAVGTRILLNQSGISASISCTHSRGGKTIIEGRTVRERPMFRVDAYDKARSFDFCGPHGRGLVRTVTRAGESRVYNLAVEEDESYCADGIVVHNCQPLSQAGQRRGFADERHLWPEWFRLIAACRPALLFGEQVSSKDGLNWVDAVRSDLENANYTFRVLDIPAASCGAPHARHRFYFVAYARERGREIIGAPWLYDRRQSRNDAARRSTADNGDAELDVDGKRCEVSGELGDASRDGDRQHGGELPGDEAQHEERATHGDHASLSASTAHGTSNHDGANDSNARALVRGAVGAADDGGNVGRTFRPGDRVRLSVDPTWGGAVRGFWARDVEWVFCRPTPGNQDGCFRPAESGTQPLVDWTATGLGRTRTARLRCYGNAIVLSQATEFIGAVIDALVDEGQVRGLGKPAYCADVTATDVIGTAATNTVSTAAAPTEAAANLAWTGPREGETAPSGMLYGRVPGDRWPYGPPSAHEARCNLFPHRGSPGGLFCDCAASAADDVAYGVGA